MAAFLAEAMGGPYVPAEAADRAAAIDAQRIPDPDESFAAVAAAPDGLHTLAEVVGARKTPMLEANPLRPAAADQRTAPVDPVQPVHPTAAGR